MEKLRVSARLGRTEYELADEPGPDVVKVTRRNADGVKEFFFPRDLVVRYAAEVLKRRADALVDALLGG